MVFRGKPSKACQRCRERRLKVGCHNVCRGSHLIPIQCDLQKKSCSSCIRAGTQCRGYRDTESLRVNDQTETVQAKLQTQKAKAPLANIPKSVTLDLQIRARELFFTSYIVDFSQTWDFLRPYFGPCLAPEHLTLSIDAVSLAFLSHQVYSDMAVSLSRQKYVSALRKTNAALQSVKTASNQTVLDASLLLDLFEKIDSRSYHTSDPNHAHVNGALALVKLRGLDQFTDEASLGALMRLTMNLIIGCVNKKDPIADDLQDIRAHMVKHVEQDAKWMSTGLMIESVDLASEMKTYKTSHEQRIIKCEELDRKFEMLLQEFASTLVRVHVDHQSDRILEDYYEVYPNRRMTQQWNVSRITRIIFNENIIEECTDKIDEFSKQHLTRARTVVHTMIRDICASIPQMTDCSWAAKHKLIPGSPWSHIHTLSHTLDVYILIYALYVAAWAKNCLPPVRTWIEKQLDYIIDHFGIKEAADVRSILRRGNDGAKDAPWNVFRLLGSCAYAAC